MLGRLKLGQKDQEPLPVDSVTESDVHVARLTSVGIPTSANTVSYDSIQRMLVVRRLDAPLLSRPTVGPATDRASNLVSAPVGCRQSASVVEGIRARIF